MTARLSLGGWMWGSHQCGQEIKNSEVGRGVVLRCAHPEYAWRCGWQCPWDMNKDIQQEDGWISLDLARDVGRNIHLGFIIISETPGV